MRFLKFAVLAALFALPISSADAGVFGSVLFSTSNMRVQRSDTLNGTYFDVGFGGLSVTATSLTVVNNANLNGVNDTNVGVYGAVPVADTPQAFVTSGSEVPPLENTFTRTVPLPATSAFARADSLTTGSLLAPGGLNTSAVAEIEASDLSLGGSIGSTTGASTFLLTVAQAGFYRLQFDATLDLLVSSTGPPALREVSASSAMTIQINGTSVSLDSPAGLLNQSVVGDAATGLQVFSNITTGGIELAAFSPHALTIGQQTQVILAAVPEPTSALAFVGLLAIGGLGRRRKR